MAWKDQSGASYTGASGQMAVIAELFLRQCNAAIPHVDVGTDVFAFRDDREDVARIQVKTANAKWYKRRDGYSAKIGVSMKQLRRVDPRPLYYAFVVRLEDQWGSFVIISRSDLQDLWNRGCGSENHRSGDLELHLQFRQDNSPNQVWQLMCGTWDLSFYLNAWDQLPPLQPVNSLPLN